MVRASTSAARRQDTREKIALGGLIVKAGLRYEKRTVLLGLLVDAARKLDGDEAEQRRLEALGAKAFGNDPT